MENTHGKGVEYSRVVPIGKEDEREKSEKTTTRWEKTSIGWEAEVCGVDRQ